MDPHLEFSSRIHYGIAFPGWNRCLVSCQINYPLIFCHPDEEKPQVGDVTISDVSWDSFSVSWDVEGKEFDGFLVEVSDPDGLTDGQNHTLSGQEFSLAVTELSPSTFYRVALYGMFKGDLVDPVFAEAITGIFACHVLDHPTHQMLHPKQQTNILSHLMNLLFHTNSLLSLNQLFFFICSLHGFFICCHPVLNVAMYFSHISYIFHH